MEERRGTCEVKMKNILVWGGIYRAGRRVPVQDISGVFKFNWNMQLTQMDECGKIPHLRFGHIWYWWHRLILNLSVCIILSTFLMYIESMS